MDETGVNTAMARRYARAAGGARALGSVPKNWRGNVSVIGTLTLNGVSAAMTLDGSVDGEAFAVYIEQILGPTLRPNDLVVMDNLRVHKTARVRRAIQARGAEVRWLPPYSPELNPIEEAWSKFKTALRTAAARTREALDEAITRGLHWITRQDAIGYFQHAGYQPLPE